MILLYFIQDGVLVPDNIGAIGPGTSCGLSRLSKEEDFSDIDTDVDKNVYDIIIAGGLLKISCLMDLQSVKKSRDGKLPKDNVFYSLLYQIKMLIDLFSRYESII